MGTVYVSPRRRGVSRGERAWIPRSTGRIHAIGCFCRAMGGHPPRHKVPGSSRRWVPLPREKGAFTPFKGTPRRMIPSFAKNGGSIALTAPFLPPDTWCTLIEGGPCVCARKGVLPRTDPLLARDRRVYAIGGEAHFPGDIESIRCILPWCTRAQCTCSVRWSSTLLPHTHWDH